MHYIRYITAKPTRKTKLNIQKTSWAYPEDVTLPLPDDAVGFQLITADGQDEALQPHPDLATYFLGTVDQVVPTEHLSKAHDNGLAMAKTLCQAGCRHAFVLDDYKKSGRTIILGMTSHDVVIDPKSKKPVWPA